ncbi:hypothetical protein DRN87_05495, partial [Candidatus Geothermarchaeota archaeon]
IRSDNGIIQEGFINILNLLLRIRSIFTINAAYTIEITRDAFVLSRYSEYRYGIKASLTSISALFTP